MPGAESPVNLVDVNVIGRVCLWIGHKYKAALVARYDPECLAATLHLEFE
jgi:hypothetical protein